MVLIDLCVRIERLQAQLPPGRLHARDAKALDTLNIRYSAEFSAYLAERSIGVEFDIGIGMCPNGSNRRIDGCGGDLGDQETGAGDGQHQEREGGTPPFAKDAA